ncbi:MAG: nucleotide-binding universal stress UspA family protein [Bacteriovoracaceae bacterium]|jgi:nucleotide-binding universal stress UspA family protein
MGCLLICTDFYENSDPNVRTGYNLAKQLDLKPVLYHIDPIAPQINTLFHPPELDHIYQEDTLWEKPIERSALRNLEDQLHRLEIQKEEFEDFENYEGSITKGIEYLKDFGDLDFVCVGNNSHGVLHHFFFDSFVEKVFVNSGKDVLAVKKEMKEIRNIIFLLPFSSLKKSDFEKVSKIANLTGARVHLDCLFPLSYVGFDLTPTTDGILPLNTFQHDETEYQDSARKRIKSIENYLKVQKVKTSKSLEMLLAPDPAYSLEKLISKTQADLVMLKPQHYGFEKKTIGSANLNLINKIENNFFILS